LFPSSRGKISFAARMLTKRNRKARIALGNIIVVGLAMEG
jgi:hypothetical protein